MKTYLSKAREPLSSYTHFLGFLLSILATALLLAKSLYTQQGAFMLAGACIFGLSLTMLYGASAWYHFSNASKKAVAILRKLDHSMIYVLIAGTYTPIMLKFLPSPNGLYFALGVWAFGLLGILMKLLWMNAPRVLSTALYILMGWSILADTSAIGNMAPGAIALLFTGGIFYTIGGVVYGIKKPNLSARFGFHELFHIFVLLGSFFHFLVVYFYCLA